MKHLSLFTLLFFTVQTFSLYAGTDFKSPGSESSGQEFTSAGNLMRPFTKDDKRALKERVKALRMEKKKKFAELTDGFIRKIITEEAVVSKEEFLRAKSHGLDACIQRAIQEHMPAKAATERVKLTKQRILKAMRDLFAEASFEMEARSGTLSGQAFKGDSYHVRFKQPVFRSGTLWASYLRERAILAGSEAEQRQIINDLVQRVSNAYFESIRSQVVLKDRRRFLKQVREILKKSERMWNEGLISEIEYLNVESLQSELENDLEQAKQDFELAYLELQKELSLDIDDRIKLTPFYSYQKVMAKTSQKLKKGSTEQNIVLLDTGEPLKPLDDYIKMAYEQRPDIKLEANRLRSNIMAKRVAFGRLMPQVNLLLEFGELGESFTDIVDDPVHKPEWQSLVEVTWNLGGSTAKYTHDHDQNGASVSQFQGGTGTTTGKDSFSLALLDNIEDMYKLREAQVDIMDQFVKLEETEREVIREVKEAYFNYKRAEIQFQSQIKQLQYRRRQAQLQKHKLEQNEIQVSEYIQAEKDLVEETAQFHRVMAEYYTARAGLNRAVGARDILPVKEQQ